MNRMRFLLSLWYCIAMTTFIFYLTSNVFGWTQLILCTIALASALASMEVSAPVALLIHLITILALFTLTFCINDKSRRFCSSSNNGRSRSNSSSSTEPTGQANSSFSINSEFNRLIVSAGNAALIYSAMFMRSFPQTNYFLKIVCPVMMFVTVLADTLSIILINEITCLEPCILTHDTIMFSRQTISLVLFICGHVSSTLAKILITTVTRKRSLVQSVLFMLLIGIAIASRSPIVFDGSVRYTLGCLSGISFLAMVSCCAQIFLEVIGWIGLVSRCECWGEFGSSDSNQPLCAISVERNAHQRVFTRAYFLSGTLVTDV